MKVRPSTNIVLSTAVLNSNEFGPRGGMTKEHQWFQMLNLIRSRRRLEEVCFAEDHLNDRKQWQLMQQALSSVWHSKSMLFEAKLFYYLMARQDMPC